MKPPSREVPHTPACAADGTTWNDRARIAEHRAMNPAERLRLTIEASRAALRFADRGRRRDG